MCNAHPSFHPRSTTILEEIKIRMVSTIRLSQSGTHSTWYSVCQQCNLAPKLPTISDAFRYVTELQDCQDDAFPTCDKTVIVKPVLEGGREREWKLQISERGAQASAGLEWLESWPEHRRERGHKRVNSSEKGWGGRVFGLKAMKRLWERKQSGSRHELFRKEQSKEDLVVKRGESHY